nr:uncharacterized protein LOC123002543 [Drosophila takahashii]
MNEYEALGHMKQVHRTEIPANHYFIPHHCVLKPESSTTKLRVVFDASCKTTSNKSLNDILYAGPTVQSELFAILLRFRTHKYVFTADIEKMYRQVWIHPDDQYHQLIVWRMNPSDDLKYYRLKTVTYGTTSAPFLATKCLDYLSEKAKDQFPLGSSALKHDFYVDDCLTGANSVAEAVQIQKELNKILLPSGFKLRKWCSNNGQILTDVPEADTIKTVKLDETLKHYSVKTLGLVWMPQRDQLCGRSQKSEASIITKRVVSSESAQIFDPLGLFAPVVVKAKIFMQTLWTLNLSWDDELPQELQNDWKNYRSDLQALNSMQIPRHIYNEKVPVHQEVHTFVDASERAYGAAVYIRATYKNNQISVRLLCSKSRVAPSAKETLPRLELCAALLGAELTHRVRKDLRLPIEKASGYFWTDSTVVLSWINASSAAYHTFVSNRIAKIQAVSDPSQWRHVSSANNPADVLSRGIAASKLSEHTLWLYGPLFLHGSSDKWIKRPIIGLSDLERRTKQVSLPACQGQTGEELYNCKHSNSFRRLQRIVAYMMRFCHKRNRSSTTTLCIGELTHARTIILRTIQKIDFACEYKQLVAHKAVDKKSALVSLFPMIGKDSLIRVGGRLEKSKLPYNAKHQILLPYNDPIVRMLLREMHEENMHCGAQALRAIARQQYWIINDKTMARSIIHCCVKCTKARPKLMQQIMGNLPVDRVTQARPFFNSGVDYCGPIWIHHKLRGKRPDKAYIAVFCCFATKAVHLELVSDLTTDAFLGALRRFLSRRGRCQTIHCDNATNFVGANNKLKALEEAIFTDKAQAQIIHHCNQRQVDFKFIPPRAPSFGGLWEAAVKSAKRLLVSVTATASLTFEELNTVIVEVEAILNSRPITPMSSDPTDASALTPGHFLIGEPLTAPPDVNLSPTNKTLVKRWELVSRLKHAFWKQWSMEYLQELQTRNKWKTMSQNVKEGLLVLIKEEDNLPVMSWPMGKIVKTYPGKDNYDRTFITPGHFLIGEPLVAQPDPEPLKIKSLSAQWDQVQSLKHEFWMQWSSEHLTSLQQHPKWKKAYQNVKEGMMVILKEDNVPMLYWPIGRILRLLPGPDGYVRVVEVDTPKGVLKRAIHNLAPLFRQEDPGEKRKDINDEDEKDEKDDQEPKRRKGTTLPLLSMPLLILLLLLPLAAASPINITRRSPLNIVGNIASSLFGVLDTEYAKKMSLTIEKVKTNEDYLLELVKNQTSIIDSTINIMKRDEAAIDRRIRIMNQQRVDLTNARLDSLKTFQWLKIKMPTEIIDLPHHHISAYVALFLSLGVIVVYLWKRFQKKTPPQTSSSSKDIELAEQPRLLSSSRMHHLMPSSDAFEINIG